MNAPEKLQVMNQEFKRNQELKKLPMTKKRELDLATRQKILLSRMIVLGDAISTSFNFN
jgi:hypothetical protein